MELHSKRVKQEWRWRRRRNQLKISLLHCLIAVWSFAQLVSTGSGSSCFPTSSAKLPHFLLQAGPTYSGDQAYQAIVGSENGDYLIAGGTVTNSALTQKSYGRVSVVSRVDLATSQVRWAKTLVYESSGNSETQNVAGLALHQDGSGTDRIAIVLQKSELSTGTQEWNQFLIIDASDGGHLVKKSIRLRHYAGSSNPQVWSTSSSAMFFTDYNTVVIAWYLNTQNSGSSNLFTDENGNGYEGRMRVTSYSVADEDFSTGNYAWAVEQEKNFGQATSIAYAHYSQDEKNIYIGGACDQNYYKKQVEEWKLCVWLLKQNSGKLEITYQIELSGAFSKNDYPVIDHMKYDSNNSVNYLFGTTRRFQFSVSPVTNTDQIYIFRTEVEWDKKLKRNSEDEIVDKLIGFSKQGYVTGISGSLNSLTSFDLLLFEPDTLRLYYYRAEIKAGQGLAQLVNSEMTYIRESVFVGSRTETLGQLSGAKQSYSVGKAKYVHYSNLSTLGDNVNQMGIVLPTLRSETCLHTTDTRITITHQAQSTKVKELRDDKEQACLTDSADLWAYYIGIDDLLLDQLYNNGDKCSSYSTSITSVTPGQFTSGGACGIIADDNANEFSFVQPVIASPTCSDTAQIWSAWLVPLGSYNSQDFKLSVNLATNKIIVTAHTGTSFSDVTFEAKFQLPNGQPSPATSFLFAVSQSANSCSMTTGPYQNAHTYAIGSGEGSYDFTDIVATGCTPTYTSSVTITSGLAPDVAIFDTSGGKEVKWGTSSASYASTYLVTINAMGGCSIKTETYTVTVAQGCSVDSLTLSAKFAATIVTYDVYDSQNDWTWADSDITSSQSLAPASCGGLRWTVTDNSDAALDSFVFTVANPATATKTLSTATSNPNKAATYQVKFKVAYGSHSSVSASVTTNVVVRNLCASATPDLSALVVPSPVPSYSIGAPSQDLVFDLSKIQAGAGTSNCPAYTFEVINTADADKLVSVSTQTSSIFTVNAGATKLVTSTSDLATVGTYSLKLRAWFHDASYSGFYTTKGEQAFTITLENPCSNGDAALTLGTSPFSDASYSLGDATPIEQSWSGDQATMTGTTVSCGAQSIEFMQSTDGGSTYAAFSTVFSVNTGASKFTKPVSSSNTELGTYHIRYRVVLASYTGTTSAWSSPFVITVAQGCSGDSLTLSAKFAATIVTYDVYDSQNDWTWADSDITSSQSLAPASCGGLRWTVTDNSDAALDSFVFTVANLATATKTLSTATSNPNKAATYQVKFKVAYDSHSSVSASVTTNVVVRNLCASATPDLSALVVPSPVPSYSIGAPSQDLVFDLSKIQAGAGTSNCPAYTFEVINTADADKLVSVSTQTSSIFTVNAGATKLVTSTSDLATVGTYSLKLRAWFHDASYSGFYTTKGEQAFTITLENPCSNGDAALTLGTSPFSDASYQIGATSPVIQSWNTSPLAVLSGTAINCGPLSTVFEESKDGGATYGAISSVFFINTGSSQFEKPASSDQAQTGIYYIRYKVQLASYTSTQTAYSSSFIITILTDSCIPPTSLSAPPLATTQLEYTISQASQSLSIDTFSIVPSICPIIYSPSIAPASPIMTYSALSRSFAFFEASDLSQTLRTAPYQKEYTVTLQATSSSLSSQLSFKVIVKNPCVDSAFNKIIAARTKQVKHYTIGSPVASYRYSEGFSVKMATVCGGITFEVQSGLSLAISNNPSASTLEVVTQDASLAATSSSVVITSSLTDYPTVVGPDLTIEIKFTEDEVYDSVPAFETALPATLDVSLIQGEALQKTILLGKLVDPDGDAFLTEIKLPKELSFIKSKLEANGDWTLQVDYDPGITSYDVESSQYSIQLSVQQIRKNGSLYLKIFSVAVQVKVHLGFDPTANQGQERDQVDKFSPTMKIKSISKLGLVTLAFNDTIITSDADKINSTVLQVQVRASFDELQPLLGFTWKTLSFSERQVQIQLRFENPAIVSDDFRSGPDFLTITVLNPTKFISKNSFISVKNETLVTEKLPRQISLEDGAQIESMAKQGYVASASTQVFATGSFVTNLLLSSSLSLLWGLINSLQLLVFYPLINVRFPINAKTYLEALQELANLQVLPTEELEGFFSEKLDEMLEYDEVNDSTFYDFEASNYLSESTIEAGYGEPRIVQSNAFQYLVFTAAALIALLALLIRLCCWKFDCINRFMMKIWRSIFFNFLIRSTLETLLEVTIKMLIKFYILCDESAYERIESAIPIASISALFLFALAIPVFLTCKREQLDNGDFQAKYGALTADLKTKNISTRFYFMLFMLRRLFIATLIVLFTPWPWAQVQLVCLSSCGQLIYSGWYQPFQRKWMNMLEVTNEFIILLTTYFHFVYSNGFLLVEHPKVDSLVKDTETTNEVSWGHVGLLGLIITLNVFIMVFVQVYVLQRKIKISCQKCKHQKQMKELQKRKLLKQELAKSLKNVAGEPSEAPQAGAPALNQIEGAYANLNLIKKKKGKKRRSNITQNDGPKEEQDLEAISEAQNSDLEHSSMQLAVSRQQPDKDFSISRFGNEEGEQLQGILISDISYNSVNQENKTSPEKQQQHFRKAPAAAVSSVQLISTNEANNKDVVSQALSYQDAPTQISQSLEAQRQTQEPQRTPKITDYHPTFKPFCMEEFRRNIADIRAQEEGYASAKEAALAKAARTPEQRTSTVINFENNIKEFVKRQNGLFGASPYQQTESQGRPVRGLLANNSHKTQSLLPNYINLSSSDSRNLGERQQKSRTYLSDPIQLPPRPATKLMHLDLDLEILKEPYLVKEPFDPAKAEMDECLKDLFEEAAREKR